MRAIINAPKPQNVSQLKAFLGLLNYYCKFLPNLAATLSQFYNLLEKGKAWVWEEVHDSCFSKAKSVLQSPQLLAHYSSKDDLILTCDASSYGLGAVLAYKYSNSTQKPIAYASMTLSKTENKYSQTDKEALALVWAVKKFHQYLAGRSFYIFTDHKPLIYLFSKTKGIPTLASGRIQRWALTLSSYQYKIVHRPGKEISNADGLSRLPLPKSHSVGYP